LYELDFGITAGVDSSRAQKFERAVKAREKVLGIGIGIGTGLEIEDSE
jgi:hypothetical protein